MSFALIHSYHNTSVMSNVSPDLMSFQNPSNFQTATVTPKKTSLLTTSLLNRCGRSLRHLARRDGQLLPVHPGDKFAEGILNIPFHHRRMPMSAMMIGAL